MCCRLQSELYAVFLERLSVRRELGELEGLERDLCFKISNKQRSRQRLAVFTSDTEVCCNINLWDLCCKKRLNLSALQFH